MNDLDYLEEALNTSKEINDIAVRVIEILRKGVDSDQAVQLLAIAKLINRQLK